MNLIFLASGNGGNLKFINECVKEKMIDYEIKVIADRECGSLTYARNNNIENYKINYSRKDNMELKLILEKVNPKYIITNFHKIIDKELVNS